VGTQACEEEDSGGEERAEGEGEAEAEPVRGGNQTVDDPMAWIDGTVRSLIG
jgi:hypothetical protein